ncbi:MAG: hypothetical protein GY782_02895, partial [Gammaproteobacteria bacterium]|nr:hypothetical protein [Gammaproteobacteria bacterium]
LPTVPSDLAVVEIYRSDKSLMKIHTTAERVEGLIQSFLAGANDVTDQ